MEALKENEPATFKENHKNNKPLESIPFGNNIPYGIPDDSLVEKIILQVEYLFSDANVLKDKFLLKHIRRNKDGYVSLKLISSLRKVKALSKDWRVVAYSLQKSQKLQINEEKTKIRRLDPLPRVSDQDSSIHDYTVLLFHNIPGYWTYENVNRLLSEFRTIKSIVKINSRTDEMDSNVRRTLDFYGNVATFPFAVVKFDAPSEVVNAILRTSYATSLIKLVPLVHESPTIPDLSPKLDSPNVKSTKGKEYDCNNHIKISYDSRRSKHKNIYMNDSYSASNGDYKLDKDKKLVGVQKESLDALESKGKAHLPYTYRGDGPDNNRWIRKKFFNGFLTGPSVIILRQPKGPDGTKGFRTTRTTTSNSLGFYR